MAILPLVVGCFGAEIEGGRPLPLGGAVDAGVPPMTPDASSQEPAPDAAPGTPATPTVPTASCMAKGYTARGTLTSLYRLSTQNRTWLAAASECAADVPGATHLVVLSSQAEVIFVNDALGWIGLSDRATENVFVNVTNEPNDMRPFSTGQPDNGSNSEDCVQMKSDGLDDDQCDNTHAYICECDGRAPSP